MKILAFAFINATALTLMILLMLGAGKFDPRKPSKAQVGLTLCLLAAIWMVLFATFRMKVGS